MRLKQIFLAALLLLVVPTAFAQKQKKVKIKELPSDCEYVGFRSVCPEGVRQVKRTIETDNPMPHLDNVPLYGLADTLGNFLVEPIYSREIVFQKSGYARVEKRSAEGVKEGLIDFTGREVVPCSWDFVAPPSCGLIRVGVGPDQGRKFGYLNLAGEVVIKPQYAKAEDFERGRAIVQIGAKCGVIDTLGAIVIQPIYDDIKGFAGDYIIVGVDGKYYTKYGVIDQAGKQLIPNNYYAIDAVRDERVVACRVIGGKLKYGLIDYANQVVLPFEYDYMSPIRSKTIWVGRGEYPNCAYRLLDINGKVLLSQDFYELDDSGKLDHCAVAVRLPDGMLRYGVINRKGQILIPFRFDRITLFTDRDPQTGTEIECAMVELNGQSQTLMLLHK